MDTIGARVKYARKKKGLTQIEIYNLVGISSGNLSDIENNKQMPSSAALISLSREFGVSIDWLLTGNEFHENDTELLKYKTLMESAENFIKNLEPSDIDHFAKLHKLTSENRIKVEGFIEGLLLDQSKKDDSSKQQKLSSSPNINGREEAAARAEGA